MVNFTISCSLFILTFLSAMLLTLFTCNCVVDNVYLNKYHNKNIKNKNYNQKKVIVDSINDHVKDNFINTSEIISHHAMSYLKPYKTHVGDDIYLFLSHLIDSISQTQYLDLDEQLKIANAVDIRVSKDEKDDLLIDHGVVFCSLSHFINKMKNHNNTKIYYRVSRYTPNSISALEIKTVLETELTNTLQQSHHSTFSNYIEENRIYTIGQIITNIFLLFIGIIIFMYFFWIGIITFYIRYINRSANRSKVVIKQCRNTVIDFSSDHCVDQTQSMNSFVKIKKTYS